MDNCSGVLDRKTKLIGRLNNSVIGGGSLFLEDTLLMDNWIEVEEENRFVYQYSNPELNENFFIQINPIIGEEDEEKILEAGIFKDIFMDPEISNTIYNIYSTSKPAIDIKIFIIATNVKKR